MSHDVVTIGEAMLRLWTRPGTRLETAPSFEVAVAGAEANVAVALARMGASVAFLTRLPDSPLGRRVAHEIGGHGVDVSGVRWALGERVGTYYVELATAPRPTRVIYDRAGSAAAAMGVDDVAWDVVEAARIVHVSGITPALSDSCLEVVEEVRRRSAALSVDVNFRTKLWPEQRAGAVLGELCRGAEIVTATREDARDVFGLTGEPADVVRDLEALTGARHVVVTLGAGGAAWRSGGAAGAADGHDADVVDRVGAGDAFAAGVLLGWLGGDVGDGVRRGLAMAALKLGIHGDQLTVDAAEVDAVMRGSDREVSR